MPKFHFDFVVSGLTETQVGQLMVGIIEVVESCGGSVIEEPRRGELAGQPGASALPFAVRQIYPAPIAHPGETI
jgi:hypothetical protein